MKSMFKFSLLAALCVAAISCGIPEEQYNAKVDEVNKLTKDLNAASQAYEEMQRKLNQMSVENQKMANRLQELGQNVQSLLGQKSELASDLEATRAREARLRAEKEAQRQRMAQYRKVIEQFKELVNSGKLRIKIVDGQMVVQMASSILFDTGKANLSEEGESALLELANILASIPNRKFQIAGHTDNVPINSRKFPSNWELATARAVTVVRFLQDNGVPPENISAAGYAEFRPSESNDSKEGQAANRRIEITLLPNLNELPDLSELEKDLK
ncbi:MAG: OmpA family protein [Deltaproteobacteria bacterium]|nr:OmpA family protein [Deltaproteobacteria bacterium]MBN2670233.1 OmpA family protein [Deltaproteobacteria bacterium]